ncbi:hypothetical protein [Variovorax atrisoli]|uniref:hypothetical protein n=1 Tax=Variovorax atrisoli TaxID=3394203 RepID=UPI003395D3F5
MSGQPPRKFDPTPTRYGDVGNTADAPSVNTQLYKPTAAQYTNDGRGLSAIGDALGSFFNAGQKALESVDQVNHQQDLIQIERENQALAKQAVADQELGKPMNPAYADRHAYAGTYQVSAADAHAFELSEGLRAHMAKQPLDGSVDLNKVARDYFKEQVGSGTGNPDFDARMLSQFSKAADQQIAQYQEASRATVMQNSTAEVIEQFTQRVLSPGGITTPQFAEMRERIGNLVHGDTTLRDKVLMAAVAGAVQNDGQGQSVLRSMQELGLDKTEPEYFNRISGEVLKRTNSVKSYDAGEALQRFHQDMAMEKGRYPHGILPPDRVAEYAQRAFGIDSIHGVGMDKFPELQHEWNRGLQKAAAENLWTVAFNGGLGTHDSMHVASSFGKAPATVLSEHYDSAMSAKVSEVSKALAATRDGTGLVRPSLTDEAAQDYARFILAGGPNGGHRAASQDTISDTYKAEMGNPLIGRDPERMQRSFNFYNSLRAGGLTDAQLHRYFPSDAAENMYQAMRSVSDGPLGIKGLAKYLAEHPSEAKDFAEAGRSGHVDLATIARKGGVVGKPEEIDRKITEARNNAMLDSAERKKWFGNAPVALDSNESARFDSLLLQQFYIQKAARGVIDLDSAVKFVAEQKGKYIVVPGFDGALRVMRDPFEGRGQTMLHPLNEDPAHPLPMAKGYAPIYAPGSKITNAMGAEEDLVITWAEDANAAHKMFPGKIAEGDKLYLEGPSAAGLSKVMTASGGTIQFVPGEDVALRTGPESFFNAKAGLTATKVPLAPKEAGEFFRKNLGPGWYVQRTGWDGPTGTGYELYYGGRIKVGEKERETEIAKRQSLVMKYRAGTHVQPNGVTDLPGGAAVVYPKP